MKPGIQTNSGHYMIVKKRSNGLDGFYCKLCSKFFMGWESVCPQRETAVTVERTISVILQPVGKE